MRNVVVIIIGLLAFSCNSGEFSKIASGVERKLVVFGETSTVLKDANYLELGFSVSAHVKGNLVKFENQLFLSDFHPSIFGTPALHQDLAELRSGDSVVYKLSYFEIKDQILDEFTIRDLMLKDSAQVTLCIGVPLAMTQAEFLDYTQERVKKGLAQEMTLINDYLDNKNLTDRVIRKGDLHYLKTSELNSTAVKIGDDIAIAYKCSFLDETVFDEVTLDLPLYINLGAPDQVIVGIESILKELNEGETARVIIPSYLAFGENGSTDGRVPPKTPIIADIKLVEILE